MTINNWKPVVKSFLTIAAKHGLVLQGVDNGDGYEKISDLSKGADEASATDEARVYFETPEGKVIGAYLVLGNEPFETVCDYHCHPLMDKASDEFSEAWENKKVPKKTITR